MKIFRGGKNEFLSSVPVTQRLLSQAALLEQLPQAGVMDEVQNEL